MADLKPLYIKLTDKFELSPTLTELEIATIKHFFIREKALKHFKKLHRPEKTKFLQKLAIKVEEYFEKKGITKIEDIPLPDNWSLTEVAPTDNSSTISSEEKEDDFFFTNQNLKELTIDEHWQVLICNGNQLTQLHLTKNLRELYCMGNHLEKLELNDELRILQAQENPLTYIKLNKKIRIVELSYLPHQKITIDNSTCIQNVTINYYID